MDFYSILIYLFPLQQDHFNNCKFGTITCPNSKYGCKVEVTRSDIDDHIRNKCQYKPLTCQWCRKDIVDIEVSI